MLWIKAEVQGPIHTSPTICARISFTALIELQIASFHLEGVDHFPVNVHDAVIDRRVIRLQVEVNTSEGLLRVVAEK